MEVTTEVGLQTEKSRGPASGHTALSFKAGFLRQDQSPFSCLDFPSPDGPAPTSTPLMSMLSMTARPGIPPAVSVPSSKMIEMLLDRCAGRERRKKLGRVSGIEPRARPRGRILGRRSQSPVGAAAHKVRAVTCVHVEARSAATAMRAIAHVKTDFGKRYALDLGDVRAGGRAVRGQAILRQQETHMRVGVGRSGIGTTIVGQA
jgi:hypothetical protein